MANNTPIAPTDILTPQELADRLKVPLSWVYEKSRSRGSHGNALPVLRCGRYLRFDYAAVCEWLRVGGK
jgi:excisionase family DNA binding protein